MFSRVEDILTNNPTIPQSRVETLLVQLMEGLPTDEHIRDLVGSPLKADTVSEMTDDTKIYIYTGSETGYTAGHWYYYNGSSWADGGVYNSAGINTDKTLSVEDKAADGKAVGDELTDLKSDLNVLMPSAISADVGKMLVAKTISSGRVTEYELGDAGILPATGALEGQVPVADGKGSWLWSNSEMIRAIDPQSGQTINIPEIVDNGVSQSDTWSSYKINNALGNKQSVIITDVEGDFESTTVEGALHELHDDIEAKTYTAGSGIDISSANVISVKRKTQVHRTVTLSEDTKVVTINIGAKIKEFTLYVKATVDNDHAQSSDVKGYLRLIDSNGNIVTNNNNVQMRMWVTGIYKAAGTRYSKYKWSIDEFGLPTFMCTNHTEDPLSYVAMYTITTPESFDVNDPAGIQFQCSSASSQIMFPAGTVFDLYAILQEGEIL